MAFRSEMLLRDFYRATHTTKVFEKIGFKIIGRGTKLILMKFNDPNNESIEIMTRAGDVAIIAMEIENILDRINLPYAIFDNLYETTRKEK